MGFGSFVGGLMGGSAEKKYGKAQREQGRQQKVFNEIAAKATEASGQIAGFEETRQAKLMASRAVAVAAAGGYTTGDISNLIADIEGEGVYRASLANFEAATQAAAQRFAGEQAEELGDAQYKASKKRAKGMQLSAFGSLIDTGTTFGMFS